MPATLNKRAMERVDWFQIENARSLLGDCVIIRTSGGIARVHLRHEFSDANGFGEALVLSRDARQRCS